MLPGFRFLFAAIALSMSILVFGLGAAALLRAAHEEFASIPSWRAAPETMFAAPNEAPALAMLRVEPPAVEQRTPDSIPATEAPAEPTAIGSPTIEPETTAALNSAEPSAETAKSAMPGVESPTQDEATAAQAEAPASAGDTKIVGNETILPAPTEIAATTAEPTSTQALPDTPTEPDSTKPDATSTNLASTKIATLGGPPPIVIETQPPAKIAPAKPDKDALKKHLQVQQAIARRKAALRARAVQQAAQQPADPFAPPATTAARKR